MCEMTVLSLTPFQSECQPANKQAEAVNPKATALFRHMGGKHV